MAVETRRQKQQREREMAANLEATTRSGVKLTQLGDESPTPTLADQPQQRHEPAAAQRERRATKDSQIQERPKPKVMLNKQVLPLI